MLFPVSEFFSFDMGVHALLLLAVVVAPWALVTSGLKSSLHATDFSRENDEMPPRQSALLTRYQTLG